MAQVQPPDERSQSLVTVLIVTYNGIRFLKDCLDSVLDQDFPREQYTVTVIDNASRDGSADYVAEHYPTVKVIRLDRNYGPNKALMIVGPQIRTKYIGYLNQDIIAHRRWLSELIEVMTSHPEAAMVESNMILPRWLEYAGTRREGLVERAYVCDITVYGTHEFHVVPVTATTPPIPVLALYGAGVVSNPAILAKLDHALDPDFFAYADDLDIGLRLNTAGFQIFLAPRSVIYHNTDWHFMWDLRSIRRAVWVTQNTILAFYKSCYWSEFLFLLPYLLIGKVRKAGQNQSSFVGRLAYPLMGLPLLIIGFATALARMPHFSGRRKRTLAQRIVPRGWIIQRLLNAQWKPDPSIWMNRPGKVDVEVRHPPSPSSTGKM